MGDITFPSCSTCGTPYKFRGPSPFLLPCLSSVCETCLKTNLDYMTHCSDCKQHFSTLASDKPPCSHVCESSKLCEVCITFFDNNNSLPCPKDAVTEQEILQFALAQTPSQFLCTNKEDGYQASVWCTNCKDFLCEICQSSHSDTRATRCHETIPIQDFATVPKSQLNCDIHKGHVLELFDTSCDIFICFKCFWSSHKDCITEETNTRLNKLKTCIDIKTKSLCEKIHVNHETEQAVKDLVSDLDQKEVELNDLVKVTFDGLRAVINQREKEVQIQMRTCLDHIRLTNSDNLTTLEDHRAKCEKIVDFAKKSLRITSCSELLAIEEAIVSIHVSCVEGTLPEPRKESTSLVFSRDGLQTLKDALGNFGHFYSTLGSASPTQEYLYMSKSKFSEIRKRCLLLEKRIEMYEELAHLFERKDAFTLDASKANISKVCVTWNQTLKNSPPIKPSANNLDKVNRFDNYSGTVASRPLSTTNPEYWEVNVDIVICKPFQGSLILFEIGLCPEKCVDVIFTTVCGVPGSAILYLKNCCDHDGICLRTRAGGTDGKCWAKKLANTKGSTVSVEYGILTYPETKLRLLSGELVKFSMEKNTLILKAIGEILVNG